MVVAALFLLAFAVLDLWGFVRGAPPMWALLYRGPFAVHGLFLAVNLLDCAFLVSLLVSALFLLMRSRWAVVLAIGQLPVRILCGYGSLSGPLLSRISEGVSPLLSFLVPVVRGFQVWIDTTGVPRQGFCELDMKFFPARSVLGFEYENFRNKLRIQCIHHQIDIASVRITPDLDLRYREENGLVRFDGPDFMISLEELSPVLALLERGPHITRLRLVDRRVD